MAIKCLQTSPNLHRNIDKHYVYLQGMYLIVNKCFLLGINRRKPAGVRPFGSWVTLAQIIMAALMQVASLTGDFCGRSTWLKNKHKFPQVEWNRAAKKSQQGPEQARVNGWMRTAVSPTQVPFPTLTVREASAPSCFHSLIRGPSPAPCTQVIWIRLTQRSYTLKCVLSASGISSSHKTCRCVGF